MKISRTNVILLGMGLIATLGTFYDAKSYAQAEQTVTITPTRIAICNFFEVLKGYQSAKDQTEKMKVRQQGIEAENKRRLKIIENLQAEVETYKVGSPAAEQCLAKMRKAFVEREVWLKMEKETLLRDHGRLTEGMFKEINEAIAYISEQKNIDIVLQIPPETMTNPQNGQQSPTPLDRKAVLFYKDALDITELVMLRANKQYRINTPK